MEKIKDGGPAFETSYEAGISKRDWFATVTLLARIMRSADGQSFSKIAAECYGMADAMLTARDSLE